MSAIDILAKHNPDWINDDAHCDCGFIFEGRTAYNEHLLAALADAGHAVVTLPKPDYTDDGGHGFNRAGVFAHSGRVYDEDTDWSPEDARQIGSAWIAAAAAAEVGGSDV